MTICTFEGCETKSYIKGLCQKHFKRFKRYGDPSILKKAPPGTGSMHKAGYRLIFVDGKQVLEHRHIVEQSIGRKLPRNVHVHHKNGDKLDNRLENLEITTDEFHGYLHARRGSANESSKLTEDQVRAIRAALPFPLPEGRQRFPRFVVAKLAAEFGVDRHTISFVARRKGWRHI